MVARMGETSRCEVHGKVMYVSRKTAKKAARDRHPGDHGNAYPCDAVDGYWHWGNLGATVRRGHRSRAQRYDQHS